MHVADALLFSFAVKSEVCDQDGNLPQLPDFKTEDIKNFDNCNDFPNGNWVTDIFYYLATFFSTPCFLFCRSQLRNGHGNGPRRPRGPRNAPRQRSRSHAKQRLTSRGSPHGSDGTV